MVPVVIPVTLIALIVSLIAVTLLIASVYEAWERTARRYRRFSLALITQQAVLCYGCFEAYQLNAPVGWRYTALILSMVALIISIAYKPANDYEVPVGGLIKGWQRRFHNRKLFKGDQRERSRV